MKLSTSMNENAATLYANQFYAARDDNTGKIFIMQVTNTFADGIHHMQLTEDDKSILCIGVPIGITKTKDFVYPLKFPKHLAHVEVSLGNFLNLRGVSGDTKDEALQNLNHLYRSAYEFTK